MSQSSLLANIKTTVVRENGGFKVVVPELDNSDLIKGYVRTIIGRCMNPTIQRMSDLLFMLPRIWNVEDRVGLVDLGAGCFQVDFDEDTDIETVLAAGPYHFDNWMLSVVRWEPVIAPNYPSEITFWVKVMGVPIHYWIAPVFVGVAEGLGIYREVDLNGGRVRVTVDGFKPLIFESKLEFKGGMSLPLTLKYEKLVGYCRRCHSLRHDTPVCDIDRVVEKVGNFSDGDGFTQVQRGNKSYAGAVVHGKPSGPPVEHRTGTGKSGYNQAGRGQRMGKERSYGHNGKNYHPRQQSWRPSSRGGGGFMADARRVGDGRNSQVTMDVRKQSSEARGPLVSTEATVVNEIGEPSGEARRDDVGLLGRRSGSLPPLQIPEPDLTGLITKIGAEPILEQEGSDPIPDLAMDDAEVEQGEVTGMEEKLQNSDFNVESFLENDDLLSELDQNQKMEGLLDNGLFAEEEPGDDGLEVELGAHEGTINGNDGLDLTGGNMDSQVVREASKLETTIDEKKGVRGQGGTKKRATKLPVALPAAASKKRNLQMMSPRRKQAPKFGEGLYPGKPGDGPGNKGGNVPPKKDA